MAFRKRLSCQRQVNIEELIRDLAEEDEVDGSALKKQGEDRQEKIRKLEERVELVAEQVEPVLAESDEKR